MVIIYIYTYAVISTINHSYWSYKPHTYIYIYIIHIQDRLNDSPDLPPLRRCFAAAPGTMACLATSQGASPAPHGRRSARSARSRWRRRWMFGKCGEFPWISDFWWGNLGIFDGIDDIFIDFIAGWWFQTWMDYFPFHIWDVILPIDELIFFRGVGIPPTRYTVYSIHLSLQYVYIYNNCICINDWGL